MDKFKLLLMQWSIPSKVIEIALNKLKGHPQTFVGMLCFSNIISSLHLCL